MTGHNEEIYAPIIKSWIPDIGADDLKWLCNKAASAYQKLAKEEDCIDNFRVSRLVDGQWSERYADALKNGCCGFEDKKFTNPLTGNRFIAGWNFGH